MTRISLLLTILLAGFTAPAAAQEWRFVGGTEQGAFFYDTESSSQQIEGHILLTGIRAVLLVGNDVNVVDMHGLYDCAGRRWHVYAIVVEGEYIKNDRKWDDVKPGTIAATFLAIACLRVTPEPYIRTEVD